MKLLLSLVQKLYLKIYYLSEKEFSVDEILRKEVNELVEKLIQNYKLLKSDLENIKSVEWIYYKDIEVFWMDAERRKNIHHSWLILSEYVPTMYKELKKITD